MRTQIAAANWKMNLTLQQANTLVDDLLALPHSLTTNQQVVFGIPFPYLQFFAEKLKDKQNVFVAAQNCYTKLSGAYTGETSVQMLQSIGVTHVIIGHSERREYFNESHEMLKEKVDIILANNLTPIFCCGEPLSIREAETQNQFVQQQIEDSLFHLSSEQAKKIVIAYEPIWAIGTGKTASSQQAQDIQAFIRQLLASKFGEDVANAIPILYGGSVKANNAKELFDMPDIDGGLVGGASLIPAEFNAIINA
ncbi:MAG: triose-phosphate isomerase, partial [Chitinophagaceae bacterium]